MLPFEDMSGAKDQEYFSDGLAEQLINDLDKVSGLKVVGRSSAFQFKGKNEDLRDVGRKLGVANVLEGSVRRDGNHITAELIKADDGFQLWSQTYDSIRCMCAYGITRIQIIYSRYFSASGRGNRAKLICLA